MAFGKQGAGTGHLGAVLGGVGQPPPLPAGFVYWVDPDTGLYMIDPDTGFYMLGDA